MIDLLLTLWLVFGGLYALNVSLCIIGAHKRASEKVSTSMLLTGLLITSFLIVAFFPLTMFDLKEPKAKAAKMYDHLLKAYIKIQEKNN
jgi:hypothetical protein